MFRVKVVEAFLMKDNGKQVAGVETDFYEPGMNIMSPLEISLPKCDQFKLAFMKRSSEDPLSSTPVSISDIMVRAKDATNNQSIPLSIEEGESDDIFYVYVDNSLNLEVLPINLTVRVIDICLTDTSDNSFITFRVTIDDEYKNMHYLHVEYNNLSERRKLSAEGKDDIYISLKSRSDSYVLFSPYVLLREIDEKKSDFSYPLNSIFYKQQNYYNNEHFDFSISSYSHPFLSDNISLMTVPLYNKVGLMILDRKLYKEILAINVIPYIDIIITGGISGIIDTFRINFNI